MVNVVVVIYMAVEMFGAVEPRACTNEDAAGEPLGAVVAIGSAAIGGVVVVTVWAHGATPIPTVTWACVLGVLATKHRPATAVSAKNFKVTHIFTSPCLEKGWRDEVVRDEIINLRTSSEGCLMVEEMLLAK